MPTYIPLIEEFPATGAPNRDTMQQVEFNTAMANANSWMADLPDGFNSFRAGMLALESNVESAAGTATTKAAEAVISANQAAGFTNFHGAWSSLTGAFAQYHTCENNGTRWYAKVAIPDITVAQPTVENSTWGIVIGNVGKAQITAAGGMVIGGAGGAPQELGKGANNTILGVGPTGTQGYLDSFCGYGRSLLLTNSDDLNTILPPHGSTGNASAIYVWSSGSVPENVPSGFASGFMEMRSSSSGTLRSQLIWRRSSQTGLVMRNSNDGGVTWTVDEYVRDAPNDGNTYGRKDGAWVVI